jgi:hypothetical protein
VAALTSVSSLPICQIFCAVQSRRREQLKAPGKFDGLFGALAFRSRRTLSIMAASIRR